MHHDEQVWVLIEDTRRDRTGVLVPVRVLLGDVGSRKSTMLDLNIFIYIYIYLYNLENLLFVAPFHIAFFKIR